MSPTTPNTRLKIHALSAAVAACFAATPAWSLPTAPTVANGTATFNQTGNTLTVTNSANAVIDWQKFGIAAGEVTKFIQPSASSAVLNRVVGGELSAIHGALQSNGRVWLVNPAGILVGSGGSIDTAAFVASTLGVRNEDFLAGKLTFTGPGGNVINQGSITTPGGGSVFLIGANVSNEGIITTPKGETLLAAGQTVNLVDTATPGVKIEITGAAGNTTNLGTIAAEAGRIGMAGVIVKNAGTLNASSAIEEGGRVFLRASQDTYVDGNGRIVATGRTGGQVDVFGNRVAVMDDAAIDVSGTNGGGTVRVGGDYQGKNPDVPNATISYFGPRATIKANASDNGNGGKVIVWADDVTRAFGKIFARGGENGGDGGFVETSGQRFLDIVGARVDTRAPKGHVGNWLLDPVWVTIQDYGGYPTLGGVSYPFAPDYADSTIYAEDISYAISNTSNVTIQAGMNTGAYAGNVSMANAHIVQSGGASYGLTIQAYGGSIYMGPNSSIAMDGGSVSLLAGWDGFTQTPLPGNILLTQSSITSTSGNITLQAGGTITADVTSMIAGKNVGIYAGSSSPTAFNPPGPDGRVDMYGSVSADNSITVRAARTIAGHGFFAPSITLFSKYGGVSAMDSAAIDVHTNTNNLDASVDASAVYGGIYINNHGMPLTGQVRLTDYSSQAPVCDMYSGCSYAKGVWLTTDGDLTIGTDDRFISLHGGGVNVSTNGALKFSGNLNNTHLAAPVSNYSSTAWSPGGLHFSGNSVEVMSGSSLNVATDISFLGSGPLVVGGAVTSTAGRVDLAGYAPESSVTVNAPIAGAAGVSIGSAGNININGTLSSSAGFISVSNWGYWSGSGGKLKVTANLSADQGIFLFGPEILVQNATLQTNTGGIDLHAGGGSIFLDNARLYTPASGSIQWFDAYSWDPYAMTATATFAYRQAVNGIQLSADGDIVMKNGSRIEAPNADVLMGLFGPTSTLWVGKAGDANRSYVLSKATTTYLDFPLRTAGGVMINDVATLKTAVGGSGFFAGSLTTPASLGKGLQVSYPLAAQTQMNSSVVDTLVSTVANSTNLNTTVGNVVPPPAGTGGTGTLASAGQSTGGGEGEFGGKHEDDKDKDKPGNGDKQAGDKDQDKGKKPVAQCRG